MVQGSHTCVVVIPFADIAMRFERCLSACVGCALCACVCAFCVLRRGGRDGVLHSWMFMWRFDTTRGCLARAHLLLHPLLVRGRDRLALRVRAVVLCHRLLRCGACLAMRALVLIQRQCLPHQRDL